MRIIPCSLTLLGSLSLASMASAQAIDRDNDGIPDARDGAPLEAEDKDGFEDEDGIPDPIHPPDAGATGGGGKKGKPEEEPAGGGGTTAKADLDKDGVLDVFDLCPEGAEDVDTFEDGDGCPDRDNDQDALPDSSDPCPMQPGDDCKHAPPLDVAGAVVFAPGTSKVLIEKSKRALDDVLGRLDSGKVKRLEVQAHTDNEGDPQKNVELTRRRADAVIGYLVSQGIDPSRLSAKGLGDAKPLKPNTTPANRAINMRVEFYSLE